MTIRRGRPGGRDAQPGSAFCRPGVRGTRERSACSARPRSPQGLPRGSGPAPCACVGERLVVGSPARAQTGRQRLRRGVDPVRAEARVPHARDAEFPWQSRRETPAGRLQRFQPCAGDGCWPNRQPETCDPGVPAPAGHNSDPIVRRSGRARLETVLLRPGAGPCGL